MKNNYKKILFILVLVLPFLFLNRKVLAEKITAYTAKQKEEKLTTPEVQKNNQNFWSTINYFKPYEFESRFLKGSGFLMDHEFVKFLDAVRHEYGKAISITSGYRTLKHNNSIVNSKGQQYSASNSPHLKGIAADMPTANFVDTVSLLRAIYKVRNNQFQNLALGVGVYGSSSRPNGFFIHLDTRKHKVVQKDAFWTGNSYPKGGYRRLTSNELSTFNQLYKDGKKQG